MALGPRRIHARSVLLQVELGMARGVGPDVLARLGLDLSALADPDGMVPEEAAYAHLEAVAAATDVERFIVELAERHTFASLGLVGVVLKHAATGRDAFVRLERYQHLVNELAVHRVEELPRGAVWLEERGGAPRLGRDLASEVALVTAVHLMRLGLGERFPIDFVELPRSEIVLEPYATFLGAPITCGAKRARFGFARDLLARPMPSPDADTLAALEAVLDARARAEAPRAPLLAELRRVLTRALPEGTATMDSAAHALHLSTRTLQRRLAEAGTTFADVLDELRAELARAYLARPELSVAEIAYLVGYRDAPAFHRAFRRWTGTTPEKVRQSASASR